MEEQKLLEFKVQREDPVTKETKLEIPRWRKINAANCKCPKDDSIMVVTSQDPLIAFCLKCKSYYLAE